MTEAELLQEMYEKLTNLEKKVDEIRMALIPEEEATEEELRMIRKARDEIKKGEYVTLEEAIRGLSGTA